MSIRVSRWSRLAIGLGVFYTLLTTAITWAEHATYNRTSLDLGVYTQLVWNMAHGRPFETTLLLQNRLHLAEHLALLLLPLGPLYGLVPDVRVLLLLEQAALALSGLPVFWLARCRLGPRLGLVILACYYAMPVLADVALDGVYPIVFAAVPAGLAAALALSGVRRTAAISSLLALTFEEEAALLALGVGLYLLWFRPTARGTAAVLLLAGGLWLGSAEGLVMPSFYQPTTSADETRAERHFSQLRENPAGWLQSVALNRLDPETLGALRLPRRVGQPTRCPEGGHCSALRWWLYPTAGLALLSPPALLIAGPPAASLLLADRPGRFRRHWAAPMLPVFWLAATLGLVRLAGRRRIRLAAVAALLGATLLMYHLDSSLPFGGQYDPGDIAGSALAADLSRLGARIPDGASVAASRRGLAHLANRRELYVFPPKDYGPGLWPPPELPAYALLDLQNVDVVRDLESPTGSLRTDPPYRELARTANALLLQRSGP